MVRKKVKTKLPVKKVPPEETNLKVTGLNDKCLLKVCKLLAIDDLANLAASCQRFIAVCSETFAEKYEQMNCGFPIYICQLQNDTKMECFKNMVTFFGKHIKKMRVKYDSLDYCDNKKMHDLIIEHCNASLTEIHFIDLKKSMKINKQFSQLTHLSFSNCHLGDSIIQFEKWFPNMCRLNLQLIKSIANTSCIERSFPTLEHFGLVNFVDCNISNKNIIRFIKKNPQLKSLRICRDSFGLVLDITYKFISNIDLMLPNLESLDMTYWSRGAPIPMLDELPKFSNLKDLQMVCRNSSTLPPMMKRVTSIEQLTLNIEHGAMHDTLNYVLNCSALKSFTWYINTSDEVKLLHKLSKSPLPALTQIKIYSTFGIKDNCFNRSQSLITVLDFIVYHKRLKDVVFFLKSFANVVTN